MIKKLLAAFCITLSFYTIQAQTGTWSRVKAPSPHYNQGVCLLMTDGTVICHNISGGGEGRGWDRLTPDIHGSYANGTWDSIAPMNDDRLFFSSQVLPDGRVYAAGGEYGAGGTSGEIYDPVTNTWTYCNGLPGGWNIYDGNSELLYDGTILDGAQLGPNPSFDCLYYNPTTNLYSVAPSSIYNHDEAAWLKLPDSSVLFIGIASTNSNRYLPKSGTWVNDGTTPVNLYDGPEEAGGAFMLPNGKAVFFGATPANVIYTPSGNSSPGTWAVADSFPTIQGCPVGQSDASSAMMVNGHILCAVSPTAACKGNFAAPTWFLEYDYTKNKFTQVKDSIPGMKGGDSIPVASYQTQMLDLPDGSVLVSVSQTTSYSNSYLIYTPGSGPIPQGKPTINSLTQVKCNKYMITGKLFNGISEGSSYGDDWQSATNYPVIRLTSGSNVYYAKSYNWNRIGAVQTDSLEDTAYFTLPSLPGGTYSVVVTANGFASSPVTLTTFGASLSSFKNVSCIGSNNGSATVLAADGASPYTYAWSPSGGTKATASNLSAGTYTCTVTDNGGCVTTVVVTISAPPPFTMSAKTTTNVACVGGLTGSATSTVSGGTTPYTYSWYPSGINTATATGLSAGTYTITAMDSCGNSATASVVITQPTNLKITASTVSNIPCNGENVGSASSTASGGTKAYTYNWSPSGGTSANATGLSAGTYTVHVSDSCGDIASASVTITQPPAFVVVTDSLDANNGCNGMAWAVVSGGVKPYTYDWLPGNQTTDTISNLCAGAYCCTVTDANGCKQSSCLEVVTGIDELLSGNGQIRIYPNPTYGIFQLKITNNGSGNKYNVEIFNVLGEKVYSSNCNMQNSALSINMSDRPSGMYFCRVLAEDGSLLGSEKIILVK